MAGNNALNANSTGLQSFDGTSEFLGRTLTAGSNKLTITNGDGVAGNPTADAVEANFTLNNIGGTLGETKGGTNQTTYATGDILYASAANTLSKLTAGADGTVLTLASGVPSWAAAAGGGSVTQQVQTSTTTYTTVNLATPYNDTIPQVTEGQLIFTLAITPTSATSRLVFDLSMMFGIDFDGGAGTLHIHQDGAADAIYASSFAIADNTRPENYSFRYYQTSGSTSTISFTVRVGASTSNIFINGNNTNRLYGGVSKSSFTITEIES